MEGKGQSIGFRSFRDLRFGVSHKRGGEGPGYRPKYTVLLLTGTQLGGRFGQKRLPIGLEPPVYCLRFEGFSLSGLRAACSLA